MLGGWVGCLDAKMFGCLDAWRTTQQIGCLAAWMEDNTADSEADRKGRTTLGSSAEPCLWKSQQEIHQVFESLSNMFEHPLTLPRECSRYLPSNCIRCSSSTILIRKCIKFYSEAAVNLGSSALRRAKKKGGCLIRFSAGLGLASCEGKFGECKVVRGSSSSV